MASAMTAGAVPLLDPLQAVEPPAGMDVGGGGTKKRLYSTSSDMERAPIPAQLCAERTVSPVMKRQASLNDPSRK